MADLKEWLPYLGIAWIPGFINIISAWAELDKKCKCLPFFEPLKSGGFWIWLILQFLAPVLLFWVGFVSDKPKIDLDLVFIGLVLGIGFVAFMNATTEVGSITLNIKPVYDFFVKIAYDAIAAQQTAKTAQFWTELENELIQNSAHLDRGLNYLENYFLRDVSLSDRQKQDLQRNLENTRAETVPETKVKAALNLMEVRRKHLPNVLREFGCNDAFVTHYFP